ncbi:MAG TPA: phosphate ABC transporter, permease protein PstA, partial [Candidatus Glassbacteria bacterium]|nr:phosphate ABC transporter, permease protein PstA [Candidatus Glassbacteria bacterium]
MQTPSHTPNPFAETARSRNNRWAANAARLLFLLMALLMILPLLLIIGYLFYKALPILSIDFLLTNPIRGMRAGGIWSPFLGTLYLVG